MADENVQAEQVQENVESAPSKLEIVSDSDFYAAQNASVEEPQEQEVVEVPEKQVEAAKEVEEVVVEPKVEKEKEVVEEKVYDPLSELGFSDEKDKKYLQKVLEAYKEGKIDEFLQKASVDYNKMSDEAILRLKINKQYDNIDEDLMDIVLERELSKYGYTGEDEDRDAKALKLLSLDMKKEREVLQSEQEEYKAKAYEPKIDPNQIKAQEQVSKFMDYLESHEAFAEFGRNKSVEIEGWKAEIPDGFDPKAMAKDPSILMSKFYDAKTGTFNAEKFIKFAAFAENLEKNVANLIAYGESKGLKKYHDELRGAEGGKNHESLPKKEKGKLEILN